MRPFSAPSVSLAIAGPFAEMFRSDSGTELAIGGVEKGYAESYWCVVVEGSRPCRDGLPDDGRKRRHTRPKMAAIW